MATSDDKYRLISGPFKVGWILVMFDLPVDTKKNRDKATKFRKSLLDDGYVMIQFSVYMRACPTYDRMKKHQFRLMKITPYGGNVRAIFITDKQWEKSISVTGERYNKRLRPTNQLELSEFW
ncbi:MAG: CRISPR-associated endonuclease Cas2 [Candidatus Zeuxoniibacter abyssi]|nr:MAG: CRISPR-associated endonuclease Cas2 [Candidatus Persebacteraceae bacterium AB1(2)]